MKHIAFAFLLILIPVSSWAGYGGNIGTSDNRRYSSLDDPEYWGVVRFDIGGSACTGGFVAEDIVITNQHCAVHCTQNSCSIDFFDGTKMHTGVKVKLMATPKSSSTFSGQDWAFFRSDVKNPHFKSVATQTTTGRVSRGGFGALRIISNSEIPHLKRTMAETTKKHGAACKRKGAQQYVECINKHLNQALKAQGLEPLLEDNDKFKVQTCNILRKHPESKKMVQTNCDSAGGDSGAPLLRGNTLVALNNSGPQNILNKNNNVGANALNTNNFYAILKKLIQSSSVQPTPTESTPVQTTPTEPTPVQATPTEPVQATTTEPEPIQTEPEPIQTEPDPQTMLLEYMSNFQCEE